MALALLALLIGVPALEIWVFVEVGGSIGALPTIVLTLLSAAVALPLLRSQGRVALARAQQSLDQGEVPVAGVLDGLGLMLAAVLLLIPGLVTDAIGLLLFIPPLRILLLALLLKRMVASGSTRVWTFGSGGGGGGRRAGTVIDADYEDVTRPTPSLDDNSGRDDTGRVDTGRDDGGHDKNGREPRDPDTRR